MANYKRRFDACLPRPSTNEKGVYWHRIGRAFENDRGMINIYLDSLPIANAEGAIQICLFEQFEQFEQKDEEERERPAMQSKVKPKSARQTSVDDDEIPF